MNSVGFPCGSAGKASACNVGDLGPIPGLGRSPGEGKGYPLQYSSLEKSMDCIVCGVTKIWTRLSDFHFSTRHLSLYFFLCMEELIVGILGLLVSPGRTWVSFYHCSVVLVPVSCFCCMFCC